MPDDTGVVDLPGPLAVGDVDVSGLGTQTTVTPDQSIIMRGAVPRPAGAFPSPTLPPWIPTTQQIAAQKAQEDQEFEMRKLQGQLQGLPYDQAQKATVAAMKLQGQRGYQSDLAAGKPAHEALAKWAPMMFYEHPQVFAGAVRQSFTQPRPAPRWVPADPATGAPGHFESGIGTIHVPPIQSQTGEARWVPPDPATGAPGHFATRSGGVTIPRPPSPEKPGTLTPIERDDLRFAEREIDKLQKAQEEDIEGRRAIAKAAGDQTPAQREAAAARSARGQRINTLQRKIDSYHNRVTQAVSPPTVAPTGPVAPGITPPVVARSAAVAPPAAPPKQPIPLPTRQTDLIVGQPYVTKRGVYVWTGQKLRRAQ